MDKIDKTKQTIRDCQNTFGDESGKATLRELVRYAQSDVTVIPYDSNGRIDIHAVMRNEGKRAVIIYIQAMLKKDPNAVKQTETISERKEDE